MTEGVGRPAYREVADDLRRRIAEAEFPVGAAIPSTAKLTKAYGVSITVVRAAIAQLRADGVLLGRPGKGVFVRATPEDLADRAVSVESLSRQVDELRAELRRVEGSQREQIEAGLADLRGLVERRMAELYGQLGKQYPGDERVVPDVRWPGEDGTGERTSADG